MLFPDISWYDRDNKIYINVNHYNYIEEVITIEKDIIKIELEDDGMDYSCDLDLFADIEKETVRIKKYKGIQIVCVKLDKGIEWTSLTKNNSKFIKIDWNNWRKEKSPIELNSLIGECINYPTNITKNELDDRFKNIIDNFECSDSD
jgi:hypothetical protein